MNRRKLAVKKNMIMSTKQKQLFSQPLSFIATDAYKLIVRFVSPSSIQFVFSAFSMPCRLSYFLILSNVEKLCTLRPRTPSLSAYLIHWSILDAPLGTEELGHLEMVGAIVHQLTRNLKDNQYKDPAFAPYFVDHTVGVYPAAAAGFPWNAGSMAVKGDPIADLTEDLAAEQKARVTYDNILRLSDDPDVNDVIRFLREREIVHFQRFGEGLQRLREKLDQRNVYFMNPSIDI